MASEFYVQTNSDGKVINFWDSPPSVPIGQDGWKEAIFDSPIIDQKKQKLGKINFDTSQNPVIVTQEVFDLSVEERIEILLSENQLKFTEILNKMENIPNLLSAEELKELRTKAAINKNKIMECTTHIMLDGLVLEEISLI
jgi:hypothetical protein